jgi:hypothetical protein
MSRSAKHGWERANNGDQGSHDQSRDDRVRDNSVDGAQLAPTAGPRCSTYLIDRLACIAVQFGLGCLSYGEEQLWHL